MRRIESANFHVLEDDFDDDGPRQLTADREEMKSLELASLLVKTWFLVVWPQSRYIYVLTEAKMLSCLRFFGRHVARGWSLQRPGSIFSVANRRWRRHIMRFSFTFNQEKNQKCTREVSAQEYQSPSPSHAKLQYVCATQARENAWSMELAQEKQDNFDTKHAVIHSFYMCFCWMNELVDSW